MLYLPLFKDFGKLAMHEFCEFDEGFQVFVVLRVRLRARFQDFALELSDPAELGQDSVDVFLGSDRVNKEVAFAVAWLGVIFDPPHHRQRVQRGAHRAFAESQCAVDFLERKFGLVDDHEQGSNSRLRGR